MDSGITFIKFGNNRQHFTQVPTPHGSAASLLGKSIHLFSPPQRWSSLPTKAALKLALKLYHVRKHHLATLRRPASLLLLLQCCHRHLHLLKGKFLAGVLGDFRRVMICCFIGELQRDGTKFFLHRKWCQLWLVHTKSFVPNWQSEL